MWQAMTILIEKRQHGWRTCWRRGEEAEPEKVDQEKYEVVKKRQEERRQRQENVHAGMPNMPDEWNVEITSFPCLRWDCAG